MLDISTTVMPVPAWQARLSPGDTLLYRFPLADNEASGAGPKVRPCLVIDTAERGGRRTISIAFGTTASGNANRGIEIAVRTPAGLLAAGLDRATRFVASRHVTLPLDDPSLAPIPGSPSPVLGRLDPGGLERLDMIRARMHALRDIAADRRQANRSRKAAAGKDFVVEYRRARRRTAIPSGERV